MRARVYIGHGVRWSGRRHRCGGPLHGVPGHGGLAGLAHVIHVADATPVAEDITHVTATDATSYGTVTAVPASTATFYVRGSIATLCGVPLRHSQFFMFDDRQTLNLEFTEKIINILRI